MFAQRSSGSSTMMRKAIVQNLLFLAIFCLALFIPAGTWAWPQGWVFVVIFFGCSQAMGVWLLKTNPDLLAARMASPLSADQKPSDRWITVAIFVYMFAWLVFMPLDARRFGWSHTQPWAQVLGAVLILAAFAAWAWVLQANTFAATTIRVQSEREQTVITTGPYAIVRHPMYAATFPLMAGASLLLGSLWSLVWIAGVAVLLGLRALGEEAVMREGLPGYGDYAAKVRFRLLPGVW
jgi:protein-S-isoprenylcysteine O-methyltransferase Ste14